MLNLNWLRGIVACAVLSVFCLASCTKPQDSGSNTGESSNSSTGVSKSAATSKPARQSTAKADDVKAAKARIDALGSRSKYTPKDGDLLTEIVIQDGSNLKAEDFTLFGKLSDLEKLQIFNCRALNDDVAANLSGLKNLTSLALTNTVINDVTVEMIAKAFPNLIELDLSSNTNMTNSVMKIVSELGKLQRLTLVQNRVNDISAQRLSKLSELRITRFTRQYGSRRHGTRGRLATSETLRL